MFGHEAVYQHTNIHLGCSTISNILSLVFLFKVLACKVNFQFSVVRSRLYVALGRLDDTSYLLLVCDVIIYWY